MVTILITGTKLWLKKDAALIYCGYCRVYAGSNSPGPGDNVYAGHNGHNAGHGPDTGYVTANSPQPNPFPAIPINRVSSAKNFI